MSAVPKIFYRPKNFPKYITSSKPFAEWVARWTGPEGIKPPGHGQIEVGHLNAEDAFIHTPQSKAAFEKQVDQISGAYGNVGPGAEAWRTQAGIGNKAVLTPPALHEPPSNIGDVVAGDIPLGHFAHDPNNLIKWGALGALIGAGGVATTPQEAEANPLEIFHGTQGIHGLPRVRPTISRVIRGDIPGVYSTTDMEAAGRYATNWTGRTGEPQLFRGTIDPKNPLELNKNIDVYKIGHDMGLSDTDINGVVSKVTEWDHYHVNDPIGRRNAAILNRLISAKADQIPDIGSHAAARDVANKAFRRAMTVNGYDVGISPGHGVAGHHLTAIDFTGKNVKWLDLNGKPISRAATLIAAMTGVGAASDALAQGQTKQLSAPPEWLAKSPQIKGTETFAKRPGPIESLNANLYPTGDPVLDRINGALLANQPIPTMQQVKDIAAQGLGSVFGISDAWDKNAQAINTAGKALSNPKETLGTMRDILSTPYGQGTALGMLLPMFGPMSRIAGLKVGNKDIPFNRSTAYWAQKALERPKEFPTLATSSTKKLQEALKIKDYAGTVGEHISSPILQERLKDLLNVPIRANSAMQGIGRAPWGGRTIELNPKAKLPVSYMSTVGKNKKVFTEGTSIGVLLHELKHIKDMREGRLTPTTYGLDLQGRATLPWHKNPFEWRAELAALRAAPFEEFTSLRTPFQYSGNEPISFRDLIQTGNKKNAIIWAR